MGGAVTLVKGDTVYLSGPMTGYVNHNEDLFMDAARHLRAKGLQVIVPHELDQGEGVDVEGLGWNVDDELYEKLLARDCGVLDHVDAVVFLPGYAASGGSGREGRRAMELGLPLYLLQHDPYDRDDHGWWPLLRIEYAWYNMVSTTERMRRVASV